MTLDELAEKVENKLAELKALWPATLQYPPPPVNNDDVEEATRDVLPPDAELLAILVANPALGDITLPLDWTDDNDLSVYSVLQGAIVAAMQYRFSEEED